MLIDISSKRSSVCIRKSPITLIAVKKINDSGTVFLCSLGIPLWYYIVDSNRVIDRVSRREFPAATDAGWILHGVKVVYDQHSRDESPKRIGCTQLARLTAAYLLQEAQKKSVRKVYRLGCHFLTLQKAQKIIIWTICRPDCRKLRRCLLVWMIHSRSLPSKS